MAPPSLASRVLVIENLDSPASVEIVADYVAKRGIKSVLKVHCQDSALDAGKETMPYTDYEGAIKVPLLAMLSKNPQIDFIVLTKGIPIRLMDAPFGVGRNRPSLDSAIASLGYESKPDSIKVDIDESGFKGLCWVNRFWDPAERFSHAKFGGYLVTRLDAYTVSEAKLLSTYAVNSEKAKPTGTILIDVAEGHGIGDVKHVPWPPSVGGKLDITSISNLSYNDYDADMVVAAERLKARSFPVSIDRTETFVGRRGDLAGYCSWGSNDPKFDAEGYSLLRFAPGAIAETAVSTSGRTFLPTTGGQSLIADLIRGRVTGVKGYCDEPLLTAIASPTILFDRYTRGWTLAESFYAASRWVGWEDIVIGDPICAPYANR